MDIVWRVREGRAKRTEFMFIDPELRARYFDGKAKRQYRWKDHYARHATGDICDVMVGMGPGWFMDRDRYWYLGGMDEAHGGWGQMGVEVALKTWLSGGRQVVNRKTWFAHLFRTQPGFSWPYQITDAEVDRARAYSRDLWLNDKWPLAKRPLRWVLDHFAPVPGWNGAAVTKPAPQPEAGSEATPSDFRMSYYHSFRKRPVESAFPWSFPTWRGLPVIKYPEDLFFYQQILWNHRPDVLIETGTERGGSAHFFADVMDLIGHGQVITIDRVDHHIPDHPRIVKIIGRSTACDTLAKVRELVQGKSVMVSLDSLHVRRHVKRELVYYGPMVTQGQYLVVEDCFPREIGAAEAVDWYLARPRPFTRVESNYLMTLNAWLKRQ
jgi:cephalosporin hydroxylase